MADNLLTRLRAKDQYQHWRRLRNPDGEEAAARIEQLELAVKTSAVLGGLVSWLENDEHAAADLKCALGHEGVKRLLAALEQTGNGKTVGKTTP